MKSRLLVLGLVALGIQASACGASGRSGETRPPVRGDINPSSGSFAGVAIGDPVGAVQAQFGAQPAARQDEPVIPASDDIGDYQGPGSMKSPDEWYRYPGIVVLASRGMVDAIMITAPGTSTIEGLVVGDPLDEATDLYPGLVCGSVERESGRRYPACSAELASGRWIWFGGDPVANITLTRSMPEGL
jgi:hypothetical protein